MEKIGYDDPSEYKNFKAYCQGRDCKDCIIYYMSEGYGDHGLFWDCEEEFDNFNAGAAN